jgi:hypothetical protein
LYPPTASIHSTQQPSPPSAKGINRALTNLEASLTAPSAAAVLCLQCKKTTIDGLYLLQWSQKVLFLRAEMENILIQTKNYYRTW